ncbi:MAG TPA: chloride channel protein, partial [Ktedonobacteraceae bacterium]|nr:chloride channel protein [Ktedonobacteraceae bacterium]
PQPTGEGAAKVQPFWSSVHPWLLPIVTMAGGLIGAAIISGLAPGTEKQGTDAMINSFHTGKSPIRARIPLSKLVATAITLGTGGSAGRAGPAAQICADFGSILGTLLRLDQQDRRIVLAISIGSAIGTVFRAPLGGAVIAAEILYKNDLEMEAMIPALIASIIGHSVFGVWGGWEPLFTTPPGLAFTSPDQLLYYVLLGIVCGLVGKLYASGFSGISSFFQRIPLPRWIKPGIGGLCVGLICLAVPQVMGTGYGWVQVSMGSGLLSLPLWIILILPFAKIVTTGLSIGSGGSGGIFGPGIVIGGTLGAMVWRLCYHVLPDLPAMPAPFVIVGMMALFGSITHAPLGVMLIAAEMTNNLSILAPAMIAVSIATVLVGDTTIFVSQLSTRADSPAHRLQFSFPLLSTLVVRQAMSPLKLSFAPEQTLIEAEMLLREKTESGAPVIDQDGKLQGVLMGEDIQLMSQEERATLQVKDAMNHAVLMISPDDRLDEALEKLSSKRIDWAPVVDINGSASTNSVIAILSVSDIIRTYREMLTKSPYHIRGLVDGTVMLETTIEPSMVLVGRPLRETQLPEETLV